MMLTLTYTTMYSASFPPPSKQRRMDRERLPVIAPVGFATYFLFDPRHRLRKGAPLSERLRDARRSISLGLGTPRHIRTIHWSTEKPIVRSLRPQDIPTALPAAADSECCGAEGIAGSGSNEIIQSINEEIDWEGLATKRCYTSVTANAAEEGTMHLSLQPIKKILTNTCEADCDPVRNAASWTGWRMPRPISIAWDRTHTRIMDGATGTKTETKTTLPRISSQSSSVKDADKNFPLQPATKQTFYRSDPIPGYTGYQPRLPVVARPEIYHMTSVARSSYRQFPLCEYKMSYYSRTAPFSKMISLVTPHNPFNKIRPTESLEL